jgi:hypothetical protein
MGLTFSERLAAKLVRYHAAKKKAKARRIYKQRKRREKAKLWALLAMARAALGYKPGGLSGRKPSAEHIAAMQAGLARYWQAKRKKNTGRS